MNDTVKGAIIGAVATVLAALIPIIPNLQYIIRSKAYDKVTGSIDYPKPNETVNRTFNCSGVVTGLKSGLHLWLVVEVGDRMWPKEKAIVENNQWKATVFEDGSSNVISLSLYVADSKADKNIQKWLESGQITGNFTELKGIPHARRLTRLDNLHLNTRNP